MSSMGEHLPWCVFEAPGTVALWDGGFMKSYRCSASDVASMSAEERLQRCEGVAQALRQLGKGWAWLTEGQNVRTAGYPQSEWPTTASAILDAERRADCTKRGAQFEMRHYLTLTQSAPSRAAEALSSILTSGNRAARDRQREDFLRQTSDLAKLLNTVLRLEEMTSDDVASYLRSTISTRRQRVSADDHEVLSESLADERFERGLRFSRLGDCYLAVCTLGGFPSKSTPQLLNCLTKLPFEFRWTTRGVAMDHAEMKQLMVDREQRALGQTEFAKDAFFKSLERFTNRQPVQQSAPYQRRDREAVQLADEAGDAMTRLATRSFCHMTTTFVLWERDAAQLVKNREHLRSELQRHGLVVRNETIEPVRPWRMSLPGNRDRGRRTFSVSTRNVADLMATSSLWQGRDYDHELARRTGVKRPWMFTADPVPFRINTDVPGGAAHTLVFGATGQAAKSTLLNHLGMQFLGWPSAQVISISVGRSELGPVLLNGGAAYSLGKPDSPALQPLAYVDVESERVVALEWLQSCLVALGEAVTPDRTEALSDVLNMLATDEPGLRTMTSLVGFLRTRSPELHQALMVYTHQGIYGHIFDGNNAARIGRRRWVMFDVKELLKMSSVAAVPAILHLDHMITRWFDGRPTMLQLDELPAWVDKHPQLEKLVVRVLDTNRKDNVRAVIVGQTPAQMAHLTRLQTSLKSGCATTIYGRDAKVRTNAAAYKSMGATDTEIERIAELEFGSYLLSNEFGSRAFALNAGPIALALTGMSQPEQLAEVERLQSECDGPDGLLELLLKRKGLLEQARKVLPWKNESKEQTHAAE